MKRFSLISLSLVALALLLPSCGGTAGSNLLNLTPAQTSALKSTLTTAVLGAVDDIVAPPAVPATTTPAPTTSMLHQNHHYRGSPHAEPDPHSELQEIELAQKRLDERRNMLIQLCQKTKSPQTVQRPPGIAQAHAGLDCLHVNISELETRLQACLTPEPERIDGAADTDEPRSEFAHLLTVIGRAITRIQDLGRRVEI